MYFGKSSLLQCLLVNISLLQCLLVNIVCYNRGGNKEKQFVQSLPYCPVYKPRFSDANLGSENIPRPIHRVRNVDH